MSQHRFSLMIEAESSDEAWAKFWTMVDEGAVAFDEVEVEREEVIS